MAGLGIAIVGLMVFLGYTGLVLSSGCSFEQEEIARKSRKKPFYFKVKKGFETYYVKCHQVETEEIPAEVFNKIKG